MKIPSIARRKDCEINGMHFICGFVAKRMRNVQPGLGAFAKNATREHVQVSMTNRMNRKGAKSLYLSSTVSHFYETEYESLAVFGPVGGKVENISKCSLD